MTFAPMKISLCQTLHLEVKSWLFYIYIQSTLDLVELSVVLHLITFEKKAQRSINFSLSRRSFVLLWLCACCCLIFTHFQIHPGVFLTMFRIKVIGLLTHIEGKKCFLSKNSNSLFGPFGTNGRAPLVWPTVVLKWTNFRMPSWANFYPKINQLQIEPC